MGTWGRSEKSLNFARLARKERSRRLRVRLGLNRLDIWLLIVLFSAIVGCYFFIISWLAGAATAENARNHSLMAAVTSGAVLLALGVATATVKLIVVRENATKLISSEIRAIQQGIHMIGMFDEWVSLAGNPQAGQGGFADEARSSDYFSLMNTTLAGAANLHPAAVESAIRFYTYLKLSRDATGSLKRWNEIYPNDRKEEDVKKIVKLLTHCMIWGYISRYNMGIFLDLADREMFIDIEKNYDILFGEYAFRKLCDDHVKTVRVRRIRVLLLRNDELQNGN